MTSRPDPTWVYHITRLEHIASMIEHGVLSDRLATERGASSISIAHSHLKERRARRTVPVHPYGTLADYTPFYFAPRSPMLFAIHKGKVHGHGTDCDRIVYLASTVQHLRRRGLQVLGTDRHAVVPYAQFTANDSVLTGFVDWELMKERYWCDIPEYPDRSERRQAELLVHERVPWDSILGVATRTEPVENELRHILDTAGASTRTAVRSHWYF
ncbi:Uncharacterised protein [Nocardia farcinica]|uniref:type II toxin-antitoxin system toxin DNA ADP-ribosyl transferase DarT n=1 Tax=Nocardia farcinica TaxID=37329 RepID=UPI000E051ADC|nr:DUF4433 domain-containing protein [Nocardia farcinica]SUE29883.1 Uncharacterised protein [Nocardia farcinica]